MNFNVNRDFSTRFKAMIQSVERRDEVYLGLLDIDTHYYAGHQDKLLVYPASLSKLFAPMPLLSDFSLGRVKLTDMVLVSEENWVPLDSDTPPDSRPQLSPGDCKSWGGLLDLSLTRSDDTAANLVIEYRGRERVNQLIKNYRWQGSEITRKFVPREREKPEYQAAHYTQSCAKHLVELLYRIQMECYVCMSASALMRELLSHQGDKRTIASVLPSGVGFAHKTAWFTSSKNPELNCHAECGVVVGGGANYIIACLVNLPRDEGREVLREVGSKVHQLFSR